MVARRPKRFSLPSWLKRSVVSALTSIPDVPSLVREIAGPRVTGSWWSHPRGKAIYAAYRRACEHPDVLALKLIEGKITFVHRRIWPALLCCALDPERVKRSLRAAGAPAVKLYRAVEARGTVTIEALAPGWPGGRKALGAAKAKLEKLGLVLSREDHTASGAHETTLESWRAFVHRCGADYSAVTPGEAAEVLARYCRGRRHTLA